MNSTKSPMLVSKCPYKDIAFSSFLNAMFISIQLVYFAKNFDEINLQEVMG